MVEQPKLLLSLVANQVMDTELHMKVAFLRGRQG
jgi:hypothetical protein